MKIFDKNNKLVLEFAENSSCNETKGVMEDHLLQLSFTHYEAKPISVNDYVDFYGSRFISVAQYMPELEGVKKWSYSFNLCGIQSLLNRYFVIKNVDAENELIFSLTAPVEDHLALIVSSLNNQAGAGMFAVGTTVSSEYITIDYNGTKCDEALSQLASELGTEWWLSQNAINISRCVKGQNIELAYMSGLKNIAPQDASNIPFFTRLYPVGSERNIVYDDYGHTRLQLPNDAKFVEKGVSAYGVIPYMEVDKFADIYPKRTGEVTEVRSREVTGDNNLAYVIYYFKDSTLTFDPNDYNVPGLVKQVSFQSGELNGRDFEVNYDSGSKEFEIITQWPYNNDMQVPGSTLIPNVGDKYAVWNLRMPNEYYAIAEAEMLEAANDFMAEIYKDVTVYKADTDYTHFERMTTPILLDVGQRVRLISDFYFVDGYRDSRIVRYTRSVLRPQEMSLEISDVLSKGSIANITDSVEDVEGDIKDVDNAVNTLIKYTERNFGQVLESQRLLSMALASLAGEFTGGVSPITIQTMSIAVGDENLQFDFVESLTSKKIVNNTIVYNQDTKVLSSQSGFIMHYDIGIEDVRPERAAEEYKHWSVAEFTSPALAEVATPYYLYIIANKADQEAAFYLSEIGLEFETEEVYNLLVGILSSEFGGKRSFVTYYGYSEITPGRFTGYKFVSPDGRNYLDWLSASMNMESDTSGFSFNKNGDGKFRIKGALIQNPAGDSFPVTTFRGYYNNSETYYPGDEVSFTVDGETSSFVQTAAFPSVGIDPTDADTWTLKVSGGAPGKSSYEIALENGFVGTELEWLYSLRGADGVAGSDGTSIIWKGDVSSLPSYAQNGWAYRVTTNGTSYVRQSGQWYVMNVDGVDGTNGTNGTDGENGVSIIWKGESSTPPSNPQLNWAYRDTDNGQSYIFDGVAWRIMVKDGADGENGAAGPGVVYEGLWESGKLYRNSPIVRSVVTNGSGAWVYKGEDMTGQSSFSTTYWESWGSSFANVATGLILAERAQIKNLVVEILESYGYDSEGNQTKEKLVIGDPEQTGAGISMFDTEGDMMFRLHGGELSNESVGQGTFATADTTLNIYGYQDRVEVVIATINVVDVNNVVNIPAAQLTVVPYVVEGVDIVEVNAQLALDNTLLGIAFTSYDGSAEFASIPANKFTLSKGEHQLKLILRIVGSASSTIYERVGSAGIDFVSPNGTVVYENQFFELGKDGMRFSSSTTQKFQLQRGADGNIDAQFLGITPKAGGLNATGNYAAHVNNNAMIGLWAVARVYADGYVSDTWVYGEGHADGNRASMSISKVGTGLYYVTLKNGDFTSTLQYTAIVACENGKMYGAITDKKSNNSSGYTFKVETGNDSTRDDSDFVLYIYDLRKFFNV